MSSKQFAVGQKWKSEDGVVSTITEIDLSPRIAIVGENGHWPRIAAVDTDLIELIEDAPSKPQPQAAQASTQFTVGMEGVKTREGRSVRILCVDLKKQQPIVAAVETSSGCEHVNIYSKDGHYQTLGVDTKHDLIPPAPPKQYVRLNVYRNEDGKLYAGAGTFVSNEEAISTGRGSSNYVGCIKVELAARFDE